jgi:hypothetical protein
MDRLLGTTIGVGSAAITASSTYDWNGNVITKTDANGNTTTYTYDERGLLEIVTDADGVITEYSYDDAGNLLTSSVQKNAYSSDECSLKSYFLSNIHDLIDKLYLLHWIHYPGLILLQHVEGSVPEITDQTDLKFLNPSVV